MPCGDGDFPDGSRVSLCCAEGKEEVNYTI
jgi:hypothetical protein